MKSRNNLSILYFLLLIIFCCSKKFDAPPEYAGPDIQANLTIQALRAMHFQGNFEHITNDYVIEGIVVANDRTDNFYQSILLQDSTGGIMIRMDAFGLYNDYPIGRKIAVKLNGIWMGDYAKMIQLGSGIDQSDPSSLQLEAIPVPLFDRFITREELNNIVLPKHVRIDQLNDSLQSCLIAIDNVEFSVGDTGKTYADAINKLSVNNTLKSCAGGTVYLRTSGFADFASVKIPRGNGTIAAIYSVFGTEKQLMIRDTSDVKLNGLRCTASGYKVLLTQDFENLPVNTSVAITGWKNIAESGSVSYMEKTGSSNSYAEISAFATGRSPVVSWLITPAINLNNSANEILQFETKDGFDDGATLQAMISTNYDGGNTPSKFKWTTLKAVVSKGSVSGINTNWVPSGNISLTGFSGTIYIAFRYDAADPVNTNDKRTTTFQLDNIVVEGN